MSLFSNASIQRKLVMVISCTGPLGLSIACLVAKGDRGKCLAGGMDAYLSKPIRPQELDEVLQKYLARRAESAETPESALSKK